MPAAHGTTDPIADLVGRFERAVVATGRARRELACEIEGDLREDAAARVAAGATQREAADAVVAAFGDVRALAAAMSVELLAARGKRFASLTALGSVVLLLAWFSGMTTLVDLGFRLPAEDGWMLPVSRSLDLAGPLVVGAAIAGWIAIGRSGSLAAIVAVAVLQLAFATVLVTGAIAMAGAVTVPPPGTAVLTALIAVTVLLGSCLVAASVGVLLRWGAVRLEPLRARS